MSRACRLLYYHFIYDIIHNTYSLYSPLLLLSRIDSGWGTSAPSLRNYASSSASAAARGGVSQDDGASLSMKAKPSKRLRTVSLEGNVAIGRYCAPGLLSKAYDRLRCVLSFALRSL